MKKVLGYTAVLVSATLFLSVMSCGRTVKQETEFQALETVSEKRFEAQAVPEGSEVLSHQKEDPIFDADGVVKLSDKQYYGAVVPLGADELYCGLEGCRVAVTISGGDIARFFKRYFPYQKYTYVGAHSMHVLSNELLDAEEDGIIPNLDIHVQKPMEGQAVKIEAIWNESKRRYEMQYHNPSYIEPEPLEHKLREDGLDA